MRLMIQALLSVLLVGGAYEALSHPGSGIVADREGNIYFVDTGSGIWKLDRNRNLTRLSGPAYHWMAIDLDGRLKDATLPYFSSGDATVTRVGVNPTLLLSSDFPLTVGSEGALYYPWRSDGNALQLFRLSPNGTTTIVKGFPANSGGTALRWVNGMATGPDGSVYYTEDRAVRKITTQGQLTTIVENVTLPGCDSVPGVEAELGPYLRGLALDSQGTLYIAATGCGAVLKIAADKKVTTVLRTSSPWSPTGVAVFGNDLYVLEYLHTEGDNRRDWVPRVRKVASDGSVDTVAAIDR